MRESRSASQILFGFLPEQTVDLQNGVWKVKGWRYPHIKNEIDTATLKREIIRTANPWRFANMDGGFVGHLESGANVRVVTLDESNGVEVEPFPRKWICNSCKRVHEAPDFPCQCGTKSKKGQLFFVGYHDKCGAIRAPYIPKCPEHNQVKVIFPGTSSATEIKFSCPVCSHEIQKGFGHIKCSCGGGNLSFQPHRSSSVYTPRSIVIVNPPSRERIRAIAEAGGPPKALTWVLSGMSERTVEAIPLSSESLRRQLSSQGLPSDVVEKMIAASGLQEAKDSAASSLTLEQAVQAESQAVTIALATLESRVTLDDLASGVQRGTALHDTYNVKYPALIKRAGLAAIDLIEKFPILVGHFGYSRGDHNPGTSRLVPFKDDQGYRVYSELNETEALFVRLDPLKVLGWLKKQGFNVSDTTDPKEARVSILGMAKISDELNDSDHSVGNAIFKLVHSYSHRFMRLSAVFAGVDRSALSELLVPLHLGFFVYAAARGDFVLGGLQALFESDLHSLLEEIIFSEHRCPLDPGCSDTGAACMACLHVGEPSCRYFNRNLSRKTLFGTNGYLRAI
jgi:hypothetical protein